MTKLVIGWVWCICIYCTERCYVRRIGRYCPSPGTPPPFPKNLSGRQRLEKIGAFTTKNQTVLRIRTNRSLIILDLEFISTISNCTSLNSGKIVIQDSDSATTNSGLHKKRNNHIIITNVILNDRTYQIPLTLVFG